MDHRTIFEKDVVGYLLAEFFGFSAEFFLSVFFWDDFLRKIFFCSDRCVYCVFVNCVSRKKTKGPVSFVFFFFYAG